MYQQQQQQQPHQQHLYYNMPKSIDLPPPLHIQQQHAGYHQQQPQQGYPQGFYHQAPMTPFDITYGQSMIPSNLLVSSPYFTPPPSATPQYFNIPPPHSSQLYQQQSPSPRISQLKIRGKQGSTSQTSSNSGKRGGPYLTSMNSSSSSIDQHQNHSNHQRLNSVSRTVVFKNISESVSMHQFLDAIDHGPIEYCKMFVKPIPKSMIREGSDLDGAINFQVCYLSFNNSKIASQFYSKYSDKVDVLKEKLNDSKFLKIHLNDGDSTQDYIKLKTLNYILESNATRATRISFSVTNVKGVEDAHDEIRLFILIQCEKFGDVENLVLTLDSETITPAEDGRVAGHVEVHYCSIDSAIRCFESYLRRIQNDLQKDDAKKVKRDNKKGDDLNQKYDLRFTTVKFIKDRCDQTEIEETEETQESVDTNNLIQCIPEDEETIEGPLNSSTDLKSFITSPEIERTPNGLNIDDPISPNSSDIETSPAMKSPLNSNTNNENEDDSDNTADYSIVSSSSRFPIQPPPTFIPIVPYVSGNPLMTHSNPSLVSTHSADPVNYGNRSIYLGNLHPKTTIEEIANNVRAGGLVESINYHQEKRVCFITFIDPNVAYKFFMNHQILHQLVIHGYEINVGWAKQQSGPLHRDIMLAVTAGASRNVYIGIPNPGSELTLPSEEELRKDFSNFGSMEQINFIHNRECGFMNFLHIADAIKVVTSFEFEKEECLRRLMKNCRLETEQEIEEFYNKYRDFKISFAKDRCGNSPKFSFKKRITEDNFGYSRYLRRGSAHSQSRRESSVGTATETENFNRETIAEEAAMVFGIVHKDDADKEEQEDVANKSTELVDVPEEAEEEEAAKEADEDKEKAADEDDEEEDDDDDDDDDDVSIIIGSDDTASTTFNKDVKKGSRPQYHQNNSHHHHHHHHQGQQQHYKSKPRYQKIYHVNNYSEPSFRRSSSNVSLNSYLHYNPQAPPSTASSNGQYIQPQPVYFLPHLSRTNSASSFRSLQNQHMAAPPPPPQQQQYYMPPSPQVRYLPIVPIGPSGTPTTNLSNPYSSSGSQVMAQYLAKSQYDNQMVYMMNNEDDGTPSFDYDNNSNNGLYSRRTAGPYRRGSKR
ncbi:hypothetical protein Cantr_04202 [Candida viswanathii]|uniref:RRM domain-containing protein n=1 Tax=Candida viswanathii TaxID=5486 RepID=A0A367XP69_9ASCO|nr:hypothetical protein Cantr_04202 [Candida viswanathii]